MALIAYDATSKGLINYNGTYDISHVVQNVYGHPYIFVVTGINTTSVVWNGNENFTHLRTYQPVFPSGTNCPPIRVWGLAPSVTGTHNITITTNGGDSAVCISYSTTDPTQPASYQEEDSANNQVASWTATGHVTTNQQWVICFAALPTPTSNTFGAGSGATLRVQSDSSFYVPSKFAIFDLNAEKNAGDYGVNINLLNNVGSQSSAFITTLTIAMEPYRTNVTNTPSEQYLNGAQASPTITAIKNTTQTPSIQALRVSALTVIPNLIVEVGFVQELTFTTLQSGVRTARYSTKYPSNGDSYSSKYTKRV